MQSKCINTGSKTNKCLYVYSNYGTKTKNKQKKKHVSKLLQLRVHYCDELLNNPIGFTKRTQLKLYCTVCTVFHDYIML